MVKAEPQSKLSALPAQESADDAKYSLLASRDIIIPPRSSLPAGGSSKYLELRRDALFSQPDALAGKPGCPIASKYLELLLLEDALFFLPGDALAAKLP